MAYRSAGEIDFEMQLLNPLKQIFSNIISFIPDLVAALGIILIGWVVSIVVMNLVKKFLKAIHFDRIAETTGIAEVLDEEKIGMSPAAWISKLFYWFGLFITWMIAFDMLRLRIPSVMFDEIGRFISMVFIGLIIFMLGLFLSMVASKFVESTSRKLNAGNPVIQAGIIRWAIILFTFAAAFAHFGFPHDLIFMALAVVGATLCITFTIAFGFGGIKCIPTILNRFMKD